MDQPALDLPATPTSRRWAVDISDLTGELAKRHGVRVRRDDPALMVVTAFEVVARKLVAEFELAVERANDDTSAAVAQQIDASRRIATEVVDAATAYQAQKMREVVDGLAPVLAAEAAKLIAKLGREIGETRENTARSERRAWTAAIVAGGAAVLSIGVLVGHLV